MAIFEFPKQQKDDEGQWVPGPFDASSTKTISMVNLDLRFTYSIFIILLVLNFIACMLGQRHERGSQALTTVWTFVTDVVLSSLVSLLMSDVQADFFILLTKRHSPDHNCTRVKEMLRPDYYANYTRWTHNSCMLNHYEYNDQLGTIMAIVIPVVYVVVALGCLMARDARHSRSENDSAQVSRWSAETSGRLLSRRKRTTCFSRGISFMRQAREIVVGSEP